MTDQEMNRILNSVEQLMEDFEEDSIKSLLDCFLSIYLDSEEIGGLVEHYHSKEYEEWSGNFGYRIYSY